MGWSSPQWIVAVLLALQMIAAFIMDGKPRSEPNYNGAMIFIEALLFVGLLGWGGFWGRLRLPPPSSPWPTARGLRMVADTPGWRAPRPPRISDPVNHPPHYKSGNGIETIHVIEAFGLGFHLGNVVNYVLRSDRKGEAIEDLKKARWYLDREIARREGKPS